MSSEVILSRRMDAEIALEITNIFQRNSDTRFSWDNVDLSRLLSRASPPPLLDGTPFEKRIPASGPLITLPQCVGCAAAATTETWTPSDFNLDFFKKTMIIQPPTLLKDKCVFYTQRTTKAMTPGKRLVSSAE